VGERKKEIKEGKKADQNQGKEQKYKLSLFCCLSDACTSCLLIMTGEEGLLACRFSVVGFFNFLC
jgi:hypothetical protein